MQNQNQIVKALKGQRVTAEEKESSSRSSTLRFFQRAAQAPTLNTCRPL